MWPACPQAKHVGTVLEDKRSLLMLRDNSSTPCWLLTLVVSVARPLLLLLLLPLLPILMGVLVRICMGREGTDAAEG
jgi:hypothetical protein